MGYENIKKKKKKNSEKIAFFQMGLPFFAIFELSESAKISKNLKNGKISQFFHFSKFLIFWQILIIQKWQKMATLFEKEPFFTVFFFSIFIGFFNTRICQFIINSKISQFFHFSIFLIFWQILIIQIAH